MLMRIRKALVCSGLWLLFSVNGLAAEKGQFHDVEAFPKTLDSQCREGVAKLYDECGSQVEIIQAAVAKAAETEKTVLVVYGAEWCVWCFVFDAYIKGNYREHYYEWEHDKTLKKWVMAKKSNQSARANAKRLNQFVADNFVIAHIEADHAPDGAEAMNSVGYLESNINFYPFIASLSKTGVYAHHMFAHQAMRHDEQRKDSDGNKLKSFDRVFLMNSLSELRKVALEN